MSSIYIDPWKAIADEVQKEQARQKGVIADHSKRLAQNAAIEAERAKLAEQALQPTSQPQPADWYRHPATTKHWTER